MRSGVVGRGSRFALDLLIVSRPVTWCAVLVPFLGGYLVATRRLVPAGCFVTDRFDGAQCLAAGWRFGLVLLAMGPMCWLFAFMINDLVDLDADRANPARTNSPLVAGRISVTAAKRTVVVSALLALLGAALAGWIFLAITAVALAISWAYSAPPLRLKNRPGMDIAACSFLVGTCAVIAGWAIGAPLHGLPWIMPVVAFTHMASVYVPTTIGDYDSDIASGDRTVAVRLGRTQTYLIGQAALIVTCAIYISLSVMDYIVPRSMLPIEILGSAVAIVAYHLLFSKEREAKSIVRGMVWLAAISVAVMGTGVFLLFTGQI
ncbi:UbiA family prenyltransferase [Mycolicibacterium farcinogenes]|uniref:UbiA family prenyltransferase n=1 Tax=Mycolicibacterium farcinogenes TaxID=1802 RepID=UPI001C8DE1CB|nr:UbiA family prenyltransferase [Mycolicibacterium farcinogenes]QZH59711.1 UbiA family prenyltransferase [Mycolicibacterium farcinogenes]